MRFERLSKEHVELLYEFECENRVWFESLIAPRKDEFYSVVGVKTHVQQLVAGFDERVSAAFIMLNGSEILARANLKNVCRETKYAEVGYRVAEKHIGKGVATLCLQNLILESRNLFEIHGLRAKVLDNNPASKRVLEKQRFVAVSYKPNFYEIDGAVFGCTVFERDFQVD